MIPKKDGTGRCAAVEILINTPLISDLIEKGDIPEIKDVMKRSRELGMQTFDQAIYDLYMTDQITYEEALKNADSENEVRLMIKLNPKAGETIGGNIDGLAIKPDDYYNHQKKALYFN